MTKLGFNKHDIARDACQPQVHQGFLPGLPSRTK